MTAMYRRAAALLSLTLLLTACSAGGSHTLLPQNGASQSATLPTPQSKSPGLVHVAPMVKTAVLPSSAMQTVHGVKPKIAMGGITYSQVPGAATQAAAAPDGSLWVLSTQPAGADKYIWHYSAGTWTNISGLASRLSVAPNGTLYALNSSGAAYSYSAGTWTGLGGGCRDLTAASDGSLYVISNSATADGAIWHYASGTWTQQPGSGNRIVASWDTRSYSIPSGTISPGGFYVINSLGNIYYLSGSQYVQVPGTASDLAVINGGVFALGYPANTGGNTIYYYDLDTPGWSTPGGSGTTIASNGSTLYVVASSGAIYSGPVNPTNGALTVQLSGVSTAAKSALITVNGTPLPVATIPPGCTTPCDITQPAPAVTNALVNVKTYQGTTGTGTPLNIGNNTGTIINGQQTTLSMALNPVMNSYTISLANSIVTEGMSATMPLTVNAVDASGAGITGAYVDPNGATPTFTTSVSDATGQTTVLSTPAPATAGAILYSGVGAGPATVSVTYGSSTQSASVSYSPVTSGTIKFATIESSSNSSYLEEWGAGSSTPLRKYANGGGRLAFDPNGTVWQQASSAYKMYGYKTDGTLAGPIVLSSIYETVLAFDRSGNLYTDDFNPTPYTATVNEYHVNTDFSLTLLRSFTPAGPQILSGAVAPDGTIYLAIGSANGTPGIYEYSASSGNGTIPYVAANTLAVDAVGVDSSGKLYAKMNTMPPAVGTWASGTFGSAAPSSYALQNGSTGPILGFVITADGGGCGIAQDPSGHGIVNFSWTVATACPPTASYYDMAATLF